MPTYSQDKQDLLILALMDANDAKIHNKVNSEGALRSRIEIARNSRYFVGLASNDTLGLSNSCLLENYGWNGPCLKPNTIYWYGLTSY